AQPRSPVGLRVGRSSGDVRPLGAAPGPRPSRRGGVGGTAPPGTRHRAAEGFRPGRQLRAPRPHGQPGVPGRHGAHEARRHLHNRKGRQGRDGGGGLRPRASHRLGAAGDAAGRGRQPGQRDARREGAGHGELRARVHRPPEDHQRLLRPLRGGLRRPGTPRSLGRRDGLPAVQHPRGDRGDLRGRV
ncbi:MAG: RidA/YER057c/UK114 superfamily, group 1, partial [uncultured Acetobacteraceae bacterium]